MLGRGPSFTGMEHWAQHAIAVHIDTGLEREVTGTENRQQRPGLEVIKLFLCSTQLSMKFQLLIKAQLLKNDDFSRCQTLSWCIYSAN